MISITGINIGVVDRKCAGQAKPGAPREGNAGWGTAEAEGANRLVEGLDASVYWTNKCNRAWRG